MVGTFVGGHGVDDSFDVIDLLLVNLIGMLLQSSEWPDARQHAHQVLDRAHLSYLPQLITEVFERESIARQSTRGDVLCFLFVNGLLGALDQRKNVTHAENARDDSVRVERLECIVAFANPEELDGRTCDLADRKRRATASVTIHLG